MLTDFLLSCHTFYRNTNTLVYIYWCILINIGVPALCTESKTHFLRLTHSLSTTEVRKRQEYVELWLMNLPTCFKWISYSPRRGEKCNFFWKMEMYKWNAQNKKKNWVKLLFNRLGCSWPSISKFFKAVNAWILYRLEKYNHYFRTFLGIRH